MYISGCHSLYFPQQLNAIIAASASVKSSPKLKRMLEVGDFMPWYVLNSLPKTSRRYQSSLNLSWYTKYYRSDHFPPMSLYRLSWPWVTTWTVVKEARSMVSSSKVWIWYDGWSNGTVLLREYNIFNLAVFFNRPVFVLFQLLDTKSTDRKMTLLHYIALIVREKYPELANFYNELHFVDKAAAGK